jgi:hypothetical protein
MAKKTKSSSGVVPADKTLPATGETKEASTKMSDEVTTTPAPEVAGEAEVLTPEAETKIITTGKATDLLAEGGGVFLPSALKGVTDLAQRQEMTRQYIKQAAQVSDRLNLVAGELLFECAKNAYWKEWEFTDEKGETRKYAKFEEYCDHEFSLGYRKAMYLISMYEKFIVELDLPIDVLGGLDWSKAKELVPVITKENAADLLDKASHMTFKQVQELAKSMKAAAKTGTAGAATGASEPAEVKEKIAFTVPKEKAETIRAALALAESLSGSADPGSQLDFICSDFTASSSGMGTDGALSKLDVIIKNIERTFHVKLEITSVDADHYKTAAAPEVPAEGEVLTPGA